MEYVRLGKSNLLVSRIGLGVMRIKNDNDIQVASSLIHSAYDAGLNFFDVASEKGKSILGDSVHEIRQDIFVACSTNSRDVQNLESAVDKTLSAMHVDSIDLYQYQMSSFVPFKDSADGIYNALQKIKDSGKIKHIGAITDDFDVAKRIVKSNLYETLQFPFSVISPEETKDLVLQCEENEIGFIAMQPLCGGVLSDIPLAFGFLHQFENVVPLWGAQSAEELEQILYFNEHPPIVDEAFTADVEKTRMFFN
ncbi:MAG: aldo/keto reductase [Treponema sp.]|nr:aldo/keto reductase [Treponema sp.]